MNNMPLTLTLIIANLIFSILGWSQNGFMERFKFHVGSIIGRKDYKRLLTGNFLHADWSHLFFNMMTLYLFGEMLEPFYRFYFGDAGPLAYLALYFGSMFGGDLLSLLFHRKHYDYSAIGASGAVAGIVFAYVILDPSGWIRLFFFLPTPNWLYALLYVGYSIYGIRRQVDNIGHDAHLGGAMAGMLINFAFFYSLTLHNWPFVLLLGVPTMLFIVLLEWQPRFLQSPMVAIKNMFKGKSSLNRTTAPNPNYFEDEKKKRAKQDGLEINMKAKLQAEMDALLDKVSRKGINNLTMAERKRLDELAAYLNKSGYNSGGRAPSE